MWLELVSLLKWFGDSSKLGDLCYSASDQLFANDSRVVPVLFSFSLRGGAGASKLSALEHLESTS